MPNRRMTAVNDFPPDHAYEFELVPGFRVFGIAFLVGLRMFLSVGIIGVLRVPMFSDKSALGTLLLRSDGTSSQAAGVPMYTARDRGTFGNSLAVCYFNVSFYQESYSRKACQLGKSPVESPPLEFIPYHLRR